ncbi:hypothetical protein LOD99_1020 [Oopsacas minuta]|uniref:Uncharacterized protein n=1 Tax=Oopsacas minuta TaxID=111878 RepID=A0AAV7K1Y8_9METZ|nr:hypothetical protein LOD99_1020 [Oopsacas minuta]
MQETQEFNSNKAGEHLSHSQTLMKQQYDKKVNPIAFSKIENGDNVLIENMYRNKKRGKLQDRWLGPYPVTKVNRTTVQVLRNHSLQLVKRSTGCFTIDVVFSKFVYYAPMQ